ncbi:plasma membrane protein [Schizosaccharomyces japonicus yFS275]|uniref:Plasma membrane protein n=1 Tax=Schizosaccharomyces japonicus (strain yFS275 / FY16936) TaxID=402676 RepID=B6K698_SCHJY|nr:plasma membrane protein [Schizosaccharomyces japonicus yFS275]EEB09052.1 plasma membrane protein [Schizosaccharomyces japonicus yFS275]
MTGYYSEEKVHRHSERQHGRRFRKMGLVYFAMPLITTLMWTIGLIVLLCLWRVQDRWHTPGEPDPVYISDMGAYTKGFFVPMCAVTGGFFLITMFVIRFARHRRLLYPDRYIAEPVLGYTSIFFAACACSCLIGLAVRDDVHHDDQHWKFTVAFIVTMFVSAAANVMEWFIMLHFFSYSRYICWTTWTKLVVLVLGIICAICFGGLKSRHRSRAARFEWTTAFFLSLFYACLCADLSPTCKPGRFPNYKLQSAYKQRNSVATDILPQHDMPPPAGDVEAGYGENLARPAPPFASNEQEESNATSSGQTSFISLPPAAVAPQGRVSGDAAFPAAPRAPAAAAAAASAAVATEMPAEPRAVQVAA